MKCRYIFLLCLCFLLLCFFQSISYASIDLSGFTEINYSSRYWFCNDICNTILGYDIDSIPYTGTNSTTWQNINIDLINNFIDNETNYPNIFITSYSKYSNNNTYGNGVRYLFCNNNSFSSPTLIYFDIYIVKSDGHFVISKSTNSSSVSVTGTINTSRGESNRYLYYLTKFYNSSTNSDIIEERFSVDFTPTTLASSVSYSGDHVNVVRVGRSINYWNLGQFSSNFKECKQFNVYLAPVVNISNGSMISDGGYASSIYYKNVGINNQNKLSLGDNGYLSIPNNYIYYNQLYVLNYFGYDNDNQEITSGQELFYFKTIDSDNSIGSLINPSTTTDIDIGWINSAGNFWENSISATSGDINYFVGSTIFNDFFSGDFLSGDIFVNMPYIQRENRFSNLILSIYRNVIDCFLNVPDNPSITFDLKGNTYTFYASDFTVPNNALKEFVRVFLVVGIGILIYQQFHYIIINLSTLNIYGSLKSLEHKHTFFM